MVTGAAEATDASASPTLSAARKVDRCIIVRLRANPTTPFRADVIEMTHAISSKKTLLDGIRLVKGNFNATVIICWPGRFAMNYVRARRFQPPAARPIPIGGEPVEAPSKEFRQVGRIQARYRRRHIARRRFDVDRADRHVAAHHQPLFPAGAD